MTFDHAGNLVLTLPPTSVAGLIPLTFLVVMGAYLIGYGRGSRGSR